MEKGIYMNKGVGAMSYANNSTLQKVIMEKGKETVGESAREVCLSLKPKYFMISDMGCSSGPNTLLVVSNIINAAADACRSLNLRPPEFGVYLNDLPGNDFNTLFNFLPSFYKWVEDEKGSDVIHCSVFAAPKSFYGRVFPTHFLHFVHSTYALHWLSQVPQELVSKDGVALNKGNICISKTSPPEVHTAYYNQFKRDFNLFLKSRADEMVQGGGMVITLLGCIQSTNPDSIFELLGSTLHQMASLGIIEAEKLDKFNMPLYIPSFEELRQLVENEGSFILNKLETFIVDWSVDKTQTLDKRSEFVANTIRAALEPLLVNAFGKSIIDDLFLRFKIKVREHFIIQTGEYCNILASLAKKSPSSSKCKIPIEGL